MFHACFIWELPVKRERRRKITFTGLVRTSDIAAWFSSDWRQGKANAKTTSPICFMPPVWTTQRNGIVGTWHKQNDISKNLIFSYAVYVRSLVWTRLIFFFCYYLKFSFEHVQSRWDGRGSMRVNDSARVLRQMKARNWTLIRSHFCLLFNSRILFFAIYHHSQALSSQSTSWLHLSPVCCRMNSCRFDNPA